MGGSTPNGGGWDPTVARAADAAANAYAPAGGGGWETAGWYATLASAALGAVSAWYQVDAQKYNLKQQASNLEFQSSMATIAREQAESDAQAVIAAGAQERASLTLRQGQERASLIAGQAASGAAPGGSNAEIRASQRLIDRIDAMTLDSNTLRAKNAARMRGVNAGNEALLDQTSAQNVRGTARSLSPEMAAVSSLLGSAGTISSEWAYRNRYRRDAASTY